MGHKTHPIGFRLGITRSHTSTWFANFRNYAKLIEEDDKIRIFIEKNFSTASIARIGIKRNSDTKSIQVQIYTANPSLIVGKGGIELNNLKSELTKLINNDHKIWIKIIRIENPYNEAQLIADLAVKELEDRAPFRKVLKQAIEKIEANKGGKFQISGRLGGAEIARSEWAKCNRIPLQTLRADIDYATSTANTIYGVLGIKIWLFRSELISRPVLIDEEIL